MKKAILYKPAKTSMQSGKGKTKNWLLKFKSDKKLEFNPLMGWDRSDNTIFELNLEFVTKDSAIKYAKKNKIELDIIEPQKRKIIKKSYSDNFID